MTTQHLIRDEIISIVKKSKKLALYVESIQYSYCKTTKPYMITFLKGLPNNKLYSITTTNASIFIDLDTKPKLK